MELGSGSALPQSSTTEPDMTWNYRLVQYEHDGEAVGVGVHEAFYEDDGLAHSFTTTAITFVGDTREELVDMLTQATSDIARNPIPVAAIYGPKADDWEWLERRG